MLRRRIPPDQPPTDRTATPSSDGGPFETESEETSSVTVEGDVTNSGEKQKLEVEAHHHHHHHHHPKLPRKRSLWFVFAIGGLVGLFLAGLAKNQDLVNIELIQDLRLETLFDAIPAGILKEASDISVCVPRIALPLVYIIVYRVPLSDCRFRRNARKMLSATIRFPLGLH